MKKVCLFFESFNLYSTYVKSIVKKAQSYPYFPLISLYMRKYYAVFFMKKYKYLYNMRKRDIKNIAVLFKRENFYLFLIILLGGFYYLYSGGVSRERILGYSLLKFILSHKTRNYGKNYCCCTCGSQVHLRLERI
jgi:hypothetical protein